MAWTATTLRAALNSYLQSSETNFDAYRDTFITQAEDRIYKSIILPVNRKTTSLNLTNGEPTIDTPTDFLAPFELRINNAGDFTPVLYADVSMIRELFPNPLMTGVPRVYSMYNATQLVMTPTPTSGLTAWLNYFYKPESITTAGTSWLGTNAENCLLYACLVEGYTYLKGEADMIKFYDDKYQAAIMDLKKLGEGMEMGDAYRMNEVRVPK